MHHISGVFRGAGKETQEAGDWVCPEKRRDNIHECMQIEAEDRVGGLEKRCVYHRM